MLDLVETAPLIAFFGLVLSSIPNIRKIYLKKSVSNEDNPIIFVSLVCNGFLWTMYGILTFSNLVIFTNCIGLFVGIFYSAVYYQYCQNQGLRAKFITLVQATLLTSTIFFLVATMLETENAANFIGFLASLSSVLLNASPLSVVKSVITNKTSIYLPIPTVIATFFNALSWLLYGIYHNDSYIWLPNIFGLLSALTQIFLLFIFPRKPMPIDKPTKDEKMAFVPL